MMPVAFLLTLLAIYLYAYPKYCRHQLYLRERRRLERRFNRLHKARKDHLMYFEWAQQRGDSLERTEPMGREIESMDHEMMVLQMEIKELYDNRYNLANVPMQSIKAHRF